MRILAKFLFMFILIATTDAEAKVCFLPGVLNGDGCIDNSTGCQGYDRTTPCPEGYQEQTCIYNDRTYYRCSCKSDNVLSSEGGKYICLNGSFDSVCGCPGSETICNSALYPYESCADYTNASGSGDSCKSPADGSIRYQDCACSRTVYPYSCDERGLKEPSGTDYCEEPDGSRWYPYCICDDSYSTEECSSRTDGCTTLVEQVYNGHDNCYLCSAATCEDKNDVNLEAYWCDFLTTTEVDCARLGYIKTSKCDDGTIGVKCPFDSSYMYCPNNENESCSEGYAKTANDCGTSGSGGWSLGTTTEGAGCYQCVAKTCPTGYNAGNLGLCRFGYTLEYHPTSYAGDTRCYRCVAKECTDGYARTLIDCGTTGSGGWSLGTTIDDAGCYQCVAKTCPTGYKAGNLGLCLSDYTAEYHLTAFAGDTKCYRCVQKVQDCPDGYSANKFIACSIGQTLQEHATVKGCYACVTLQCTDGYAETAADCGTMGTTGWKLGTATDSVGCFECEEKSCSTSEFALNSVSMFCGVNMTSTLGDSYRGDRQCYKCICIDNFVKDVSECGQSGGWELDTSIVEANENGAGDVSCYKCKAKACPIGPGITTNRSECNNTPYYGYESIVGYAGNDTCYKCQLCPDGQYHTDEYECDVSGHWLYGVKTGGTDSQGNPAYSSVSSGCFDACYNYVRDDLTGVWVYFSESPTKKQ